MENVFDNIAEKIKTRFLFDTYNVIYIIMRRMRVTKATHTRTRTHARTEYVTITAFAWQQWFRERSSTLRYTYVASVVIFDCFITTYCGSVRHLWCISETISITC
jgi:hypothetical protein